MGSTHKGKNLHLKEQILSFKRYALLPLGQMAYMKMTELLPLYGVLAVLSAIGLSIHLIALKSRYCITLLIKNKPEDYTTVISFSIDSMALFTTYIYGETQ